MNQQPSFVSEQVKKNSHSMVQRGQCPWWLGLPLPQGPGVGFAQAGFQVAAWAGLSSAPSRCGDRGPRRNSQGQCHLVGLPRAGRVARA